MRGTYFFVYRVEGSYAPVKLGCYSKEQAFWLAENKWNEGRNERYTYFAVDFIKDGIWETVKSWI